MSLHVRRLLYGGLVVAITVVAVICAAFAGAATAPPPDAEAQAPVSGSVPDDPVEGAPPPRRYVAMGSVVATREDRIAVMVPSRDRPILVMVRPVTAVRVNMHKADLSQIQRGDHVVVVGRPGPRGNMIARAIVAVRKPPPTPST